MASQNRKNLFGDLVYAALLDGQLQQEDQDRLSRYGKQLGLDSAECSEVFGLVSGGTKTHLHRPKDPELRKTMFEKFVKFAMVDGKIDAREKKFLVRLAKHYDMTKDDVTALLKAAKKADPGYEVVD